MVGTYVDNSEGYQCVNRDFRMEDETFSKQIIQVGEPIEVQGKLISLSQNTYELKPWAVITNSEHASFSYDFLRIFLEPNKICVGSTSDGNINWYFNMSTEPFEAFTLEQDEEIQYSVTLIPQKAGTYRIHSAMLIDDIYRQGPGQTIIVEGRAGVTDGEIFGFYLPFSLSIVIIISGSIVGIISLKRKLKQVNS